MKYSDLMTDWLVELGYTHCFFVAGGNIMHLLESASWRLTCIPVIHEVAAGIAAEYFNEVSPKGRAFAMVTAGPGLTNIVTAMAGAYLESRELLVLGGQVKVMDLARGEIRQRGIQEIDGVSIVKSISVAAERLETIWNCAEFVELAEAGSHGRKGPVFIELPLDIQGAVVDPEKLKATQTEEALAKIPAVPAETLAQIELMLRQSSRPALLIGGGISRQTAEKVLDPLLATGIPLLCTWNGIDRVPETHPLFMGRPNTWGQRAGNIFMQQADLLIALGTRLGLQQTGFNWKGFLPIGKVIQIECDQAELDKGHPRVDLAVRGDANDVLHVIAHLRGLPDYSAWLNFGREVRSLLPANDPKNQTRPDFVSPYDFVLKISVLCESDDIVIPCSSGSANTVMQQTFKVKKGQRVFNNKSLASMGYGLSGAIGAALAGSGRRTIVVEGDGGFTQNLQELGTVAANGLNLKIFLFDDDGYASIRMTQRNYFGGRYVGCDTATGLGMPKWEHIFAAYGIPIQRLRPNFEKTLSFLDAFAAPGPAAFLVSVDPEQTYFPKISSRMTETGTMESNPLHRMTPELEDDIAVKVFPYLGQ